MMQNVQKMQKRLMETQKELESVEVTAQSAGGAVEVVYTGQAKFKRIKSFYNKSTFIFSFLFPSFLTCYLIWFGLTRCIINDIQDFKSYGKNNIIILKMIE